MALRQGTCPGLSASRSGRGASPLRGGALLGSGSRRPRPCCGTRTQGRRAVAGLQGGMGGGGAGCGCVGSPAHKGARSWTQTGTWYAQWGWATRGSLYTAQKRRQTAPPPEARAGTAGTPPPLWETTEALGFYSRLALTSQRLPVTSQRPWPITRRRSHAHFPTPRTSSQWRRLSLSPS